jgi:general secretion pathway protein G
MRNRGRIVAFTLIELLTVIAIVALLAAIIFPVFAQAKAAAKKTTCLSNLNQMGRGMLLYMGDYDDIFPFAVDPIDQAAPEIWAAEPEFQALIPQMPRIQDALQPYLKSVAVFKCPADNGTQVLDDRPWIGFVTSPSMHHVHQTSYFFRTEIAFRQYSQTRFELPSDVNIMFDAAGHWHGSAGAMTASDANGDFTQKLRKYRYNTLFGDMHVKSLNNDQLDAAWALDL